MKKILILALACYAATAFAQNTDQNYGTTKTQSGSSKDAGTMTSGKLDGKSFKITLHDNDAVQNTNRNDNNSSNSTTTGKSMNNGEATSSSNSDAMTGAKEDNLGGKKMMLHFKNGNLKTSGMNDMKVSTCSYTSSGSASSISFKADCNQMMGTSDGSNRSGTETGSMNGSTSGSDMRSQNGQTTDEYRTNTGTTGATGNQSQTGTSMQSGTTNNSRTTQSGTSGTTGSGNYGSSSTTSGSSGSSSASSSSGGGSANQSSGTSQSGTSTSGNMQSGMSGSNNYKSMMISGTVNGNSIQGTISCTKSNGTKKNYSFTGTLADQKDIDNDKEMGLNN